MNLIDQLHIYDLLMTNYSVGDRVPLSTVGTFLRSHDITPAVYGYENLHPMLAGMPDILALDSEQPRPGVPLVWYVTILARPDVEPECLPEAGSQLSIPTASFDVLPPTMESEYIYFPFNVQNLLNDFITGQHNTRADPQLLLQCRKDYLTARETGLFTHDPGHDCYNFPLTSFSAADGSALYLSLTRSTRPDGSPWYVKFVGSDNRGKPVKPGDALRRFAYLGNMAVFLRTLADYVQEEPWNFTGAADNYFILHQYINYTFYRLQLQNKVCIADDGSFAAFNTGLQSRRLGEDVFAYFTPNEPGMESPWKFACFCSSDSRDPGERRCYKTMYGAFQEPEAATYFTKISDLLFDPQCEVRLSSDHIFKDNCDRLPIDFLQRECHLHPQAQPILEQLEATSSPAARDALFEQLGEVITDDPDLFSSMHERLQGALQRTIKRIRRNYKLAVPCFFPTRNVMSMMLPLSFTASGKPSLVLVCERTLRGDYLGQTILTLPMAYIDARLLCRPGSEWLNTDQIVSSDRASLDDLEL